MSQSPSPVDVHDVPTIVEAEPVSISSGARLILWLLVLVGLVFFVLSLNGPDPRKAWVAYHVNVTFFVAISMAGAGFTAVFHICNAQWVRPIRRIFESFSAFLPLAILLFAIGYLGHTYIFEWAHVPAPGKADWLTPQFVYGRNLLGLLLLAALIRKAVYLSLRRDIGAVRGGLTGVPESRRERWSNSRFDKFMVGWPSDAVSGLKEASDSLWILSPVIVMVYALVMTMFAFDMIMSVDFHWFSTLFGALYFMSAVYVAFAGVSMGLGLLRELHPLFRAKIERRTLHDHGKLLFGFGIFWAY
ncbi:MAG: hypothetical protein KDD44_07585, partial [Bdellovibrionales bacterium]|nr:hypothetical protein [Bdellovibrionales bacterium]